MKKIIQNLPLLLTAITFLYSLTHLSAINQITEATFFTVNKLFFSLYFLMLIFSIANDIGLFQIIGSFLKPFFASLFHLNQSSSSIYFASLFSGYPTFAKIIKDAYLSKQISQSDANHLLKICSHGSMGFIVLTLGKVLFHDLKIGWYIFFIQLFSNMMIALITRNECSEMENVYLSNEKKTSLMNTLKKEMVACFKIFIYIYGFMLVFNILSHMVLQNFQYLHGFLEFSQGCLNLENDSFEIKFLMSNIYISFSSFSVIFQVVSILDGLDLDIRNYIKARILQSFIAFLLSLGFLCFI